MISVGNLILQISHDDSKSNPIEIKEASFSWNDNSALSSYDVSDCSLQHINWNVSEGSLVAVVGTVGSGKSSLLSALLGDMIRVRGEANIKGKIAYVPQQAWMQNATLKNNILFGRTYQKDLYEKVNYFSVFKLCVFPLITFWVSKQYNICLTCFWSSMYLDKIFVLFADY